MVSKKKLKKSIESFEERIKEHKEKIKTYSGEKNFLIEYWEKEINGFVKKIEKKKSRLGKDSKK